MRWRASLVALACCCLCGCRERASAEQCQTIFDRLVVLELKEMGFHDAALAKRKQRELTNRYREELAACVGRRIPDDALTCVMAAENTEAVSHDCLR